MPEIVHAYTYQSLHGQFHTAKVCLESVRAKTQGGSLRESLCVYVCVCVCVHACVRVMLDFRIVDKIKGAHARFPCPDRKSIMRFTRAH